MVSAIDDALSLLSHGQHSQLSPTTQALALRWRGWYATRPTSVLVQRVPQPVSSVRILHSELEG